jgi:hypothetical protein
MVRRLKIAVSVFFAVVTIGLCGLWARSYRWIDQVGVGPFGDYVAVATSAGGRVAIDFARTSFGRPRFYRASHTPIRSLEAELVEIAERMPSVAGFGVQAYRNGIAFMAPDWFLVPWAAVLAAAPWSRLTYRFGLRALFTLMTLLAGLLGAIAILRH